MAVQMRLAQEIARTVPIQRINTLMAEVQAARKERDQLQSEVNRLQQELDAVTNQEGLKELKTELNSYRIEAGLVAVTGPGVEVTLNDSTLIPKPGQNPNLYVLHDEDILRVLNELKAAGAEVLAINGERLVATSEVRCAGPTILVNKTKRLAAPFVITAIGNPDTMINALNMRGGVVDTLRQFWGIQVSIKKLPEVTIPAYKGSRRFEYAHPVRE
ncbi:DUF881 domain-containing protein [Ammonifex thiophilus]|uniref:DUF881 domain-containing protein n=1 Tax=Ammonifex thiophilus TaxID=444093 RepID=A0A3D8P4N5_9THEO|nr:DUF881 domain-containing protein [Ammonifex thiophilus]